MWEEQRSVFLPSDTPLFFMAGDFNMTEGFEQRGQDEPGEAEYLRGPEREEWTQAKKELGFYLLDQDVPTYCHAGLGHSSVIDRAYTNLRVGWQQEYDPFCDACHLERSAASEALTYHLPIRFCIVPTQEAEMNEQVIQPWVTTGPSWEKKGGRRVGPPS